MKITHVFAQNFCKFYGKNTLDTDFSMKIVLSGQNEVGKSTVKRIILDVLNCHDENDRDNTGKANHVFRGHLSIDTACDFVKANYSDSLQNVIMCHLSAENADRDSFIEKMKKVACGANVDVAVAGKSWDLKNPNECPF